MHEAMNMSRQLVANETQYKTLHENWKKNTQHRTKRWTMYTVFFFPHSQTQDIDKRYICRCQLINSTYRLKIPHTYVHFIYPQYVVSITLIYTVRLETGHTWFATNPFRMYALFVAWKFNFEWNSLHSIRW